MKTRNERELEAVRKLMGQKANEIEAIWKKATDDDRANTDEENADANDLLKEIKTVLKPREEELEKAIATEKEIKDVSRSLGPVSSSISVGSEPQDRFIEFANQNVFPQAQKSLGEQFITSDGYKKALDEYKGAGGTWRQGMTTGPVSLDMKGTLLEGAGSPGAGSGGGYLPVPQVVPGVVETLFQRLTIADLLMSGQASGNTVRYVVEGTATSGAAGVAEAGSKPESVLGVGTKDEPIKKIATFLPISDEMLEDAPAVQSYINGRLSLFVRIEEERQLLRGSSGGNEVQGLLTSRNVPVQGTAAWASGDAIGDKLFKAANSMRTTAFVEPEWIVLHPTDWQSLRLLKDGTGGTQGQYYGGGPFLGAYGAGGPAGNSNQVNAGATDTIWGKPAIVTPIVGAGTALIGTRANAQVWRRGGLTVEASNSHSNYFQLNLVALRAEERLGLAVYRPGAFVEVHFTTA